MVATLHYALKSSPSELYEGGNWMVLTQYILHANIRNRCWPTMQHIVKNLGKSLPFITTAKQWLVEHGAIEIVPVDQRVGEEKKLPAHQHVYQLTGIIKFGDVTIPYLYTSDDNGQIETNDQSGESSNPLMIKTVDDQKLSLQSIPKKDSTSNPTTSDSSFHSESSESRAVNSTNTEAPSKQGEVSTEGQPSPVASSERVIAQVYEAIPLRPSVDISFETLRVKTNLEIGDIAASVDVLLKRGVIRKTSDIPTYARAPNGARIAYCNHCKTDRTWAESIIHGVYGCDVCKSLVTEAILWPEPSAIVNTEPVEPPAGFELLSGTASDAPIHLRKAGQSLRAKPLCKDELSYRLKPTPDMTRSRKKCEKCWKIATEPKQPKAKREKKPQIWDPLGNALAKELFGAKDQAGINAVFGRVAPILHGDKRSGKCIGLIAYECEKQGKDKAELDYQALADMVPVFYKDVLKINSIPPKDCAKVLDAWQAWRSRQKSSGPKKLGVDFQIVEPDDYIAPGPAR